jgi:hypothetical protein
VRKPEPVACVPSSSSKEKLVALLHLIEIVADARTVTAAPPGLMFLPKLNGVMLTVKQLPATALAGSEIANASVNARRVADRQNNPNLSP